jgi:hypothetical protein
MRRNAIVKLSYYAFVLVAALFITCSSDRCAGVVKRERHQTLARCREKAASVDLALEADDDASAWRTMKMSASALLEHHPEVEAVVQAMTFADLGRVA